MFSPITEHAYTYKYICTHAHTYIHIRFVSSSTNKNTYIFLNWNPMKFLIPTTTLPRGADAYNPYTFIAETLTRMCPALSYSILREAGFFSGCALRDSIFQASFSTICTTNTETGWPAHYWAHKHRLPTITYKAQTDKYLFPKSKKKATPSIYLCKLGLHEHTGTLETYQKTGPSIYWLHQTPKRL